MCCTFTIQSLVDGHVGCFYLIAIVIRGSMNIDKHISRVGYGALWVYGRDKPTSGETATLISTLPTPSSDEYAFLFSHTHASICDHLFWLFLGVLIGIR